jgi:midasin
MQLVHSFEKYVAVINPSKSPLLRTAFQRVRRILSSAYRYYHLFSDQLRKNLLDEKVALEKEVNAFIKLASWKDVNVQALKQSAQRSHRQLYKVMKKFRDVLRQPVVHRLQPHHASEPEVRPLSLDEPPVLTPPILVETLFVSPVDSLLVNRDYLSNLKRTFDRYNALIGKRIRPFISGRSAEKVDGVAVEIITTSKSLASLSVPPSLSGDLQIKYQKALLVRKRKAWGDMLKELKHAGLASNVKPEVLQQNTNQQWIREQPSLLEVSGVEVKVDKGESYFVKLCGSLPSLRGSLPTHHSDLTTRELQRGTMFLESGFAMAVDLRSRLDPLYDRIFVLTHPFE